MSSRRLTFALAAAALVASTSASAWDPVIVGLDDDTVPGASAVYVASDASAGKVTPELVSDAAQPESVKGPTLTSAIAATPQPEPVSADAEAVADAPERIADQVARVSPNP